MILIRNKRQKMFKVIIKLKLQKHNPIIHKLRTKTAYKLTSVPKYSILQKRLGVTKNINKEYFERDQII